MMNKMKIKKGDTVKVLSGKDKGRTGKILSVVVDRGLVVVEGVNIHTRFQKSKKAGQPGTRITLPSPFSVSKVQLIDGTTGLPTRVAYKILDNGTKQRIAKKSGKAV